MSASLRVTGRLAALNATQSVAESGGQTADSDSQKETEINEYNERFAQRIGEIKQACGINQEEKTDVD